MWTLRTGAGMDARLAKRSEAEPELRLGFSITSLMTRCWISSQRTATGPRQLLETNGSQSVATFVRTALHGYFLKPVVEQAFWRLASWRLTFHNFHHYWYDPRDSPGLESPVWYVQCCEALTLLSKRYHQAKAEKASTLTPILLPVGFHTSDGNRGRCRCWTSNGISWCQQG